MREIFISIIEDDLNNSIPIYDRIKEIGKNQKYVDFAAINEIRYFRKIYEKFIENVSLIESHSLRKRVFNYYMKSGALIDKLENFQKIIYSHQEAIRNKGGEPAPEDVSTKYNRDQIVVFFNAIQAEVGNLDNFKIDAQFILQELRFSKK